MNIILPLARRTWLRWSPELFDDASGVFANQAHDYGTSMRIEAERLSRERKLRIIRPEEIKRVVHHGWEDYALRVKLIDEWSWDNVNASILLVHAVGLVVELAMGESLDEVAMMRLCNAREWFARNIQREPWNGLIVAYAPAQANPRPKDQLCWSLSPRVALDLDALDELDGDTLLDEYKAA